MDIEQRPPNQPNFRLILGLFAAAIVIIIVVALLFVGKGARHLPDGRSAIAAPALHIRSA